MGLVIIILSEWICKQHLLYDTSHANEEKVANATSNFSAIRGIQLMEFIFFTDIGVNYISQKHWSTNFFIYPTRIFEI